ncbi:MAG: TetR/AcrR family transcriptional regulator [Hydrogenophaga sp.]|uniref:TetR/AcrR family transcriptional regulator n=1 Tax=Hydrogenophaga sp. TaxID=1904254 RepID=UPI003D13B981
MKATTNALAKAAHVPGSSTVASLDELRNWIAEGRLPELVPTQQDRSLRTALAMIEAGRQLLRDRSLEDLSVEMVCRAAGTTVGAFYGRFENKHAFFMTMERVQTFHSESIFADFSRKHKSSPSTLDDLCLDMVSLTVNGFRSNLGVLRAALQHTQEGMWDLFKASGDRYRVELIDRISPHLTHLPPRQRKLRILFAYQALAGTLVHATLNNPGPLAFEDEALVTELTRMVKAYLEAP